MISLNDAFSALTGADAEDIRAGEARNGLVHVAALTLTKTADALVDPKLVLSWLLTALSAPGAMIGLLVPVREVGALLPQLGLTRQVERSPQRKKFWAAGAALQGIAALGMTVGALMLSGAAAGAAIILCLAVLAAARSASSVSYKDALARTIVKRRRGAIMGLAASVASVSVFAVGLLMTAGLFAAAVAPLSIMIAVAGTAFLLAAAIFLTLREPEAQPDQAPDGGSLAALVEPIIADS